MSEGLGLSLRHNLDVLDFCDLAFETLDTYLAEICNQYNLLDLAKYLACFKNPSKPYFIDFILTNQSKSFNKTTVEKNLSDIVQPRNQLELIQKIRA